MTQDESALLEPGNAYQSRYRDEFQKNVAAYLDRLVTDSHMDVAANQKAAEAYRTQTALAAALEKKVRRVRVGKGLLLSLGIVCLLLCAPVAYQGSWAIAVPLGVLGVAALVLTFTAMRRALQKRQTALEAARQAAKEAYRQAMGTIAPFLDLLDNGVTKRLVQMTVPTLVLDPNFNMKRYDYLSGKYGYPEQDGADTSTVGILSGEIVGNPFVFERKLQQTWAKMTYTGSLEIKWTEYHRDGNGKMVAEHHSETLHASITRSAPDYHYRNCLVYGNDAAPDLVFSRTKTHVEAMSEKKQKSFVKSRTKKIYKQKKTQMASGFTALGNAEFDALFGAFDRNNEPQFRLLFTPLAQKNLLSLMRETSPYGDDFDFRKDRCINVLESDHLQKWNLNIDTEQYSSYDLALCKKAFMELNSAYFQSLYFDFAPLLSIPLYQQMKPKEYIYQIAYPRNYTVREAEVLANRIGDQGLVSANAATPAIFKTKFESKKGKADYVQIAAHAFKGVPRVEYVSVYGGDGRWHKVPVHWTEYLPVTKNSRMRLEALDLNDREFRHSDLAKTAQPHTYYHSIFAKMI